MPSTKRSTTTPSLPSLLLPLYAPPFINHIIQWSTWGIGSHCLRLSSLYPLLLLRAWEIITSQSRHYIVPCCQCSVWNAFHPYLHIHPIAAAAFPGLITLASLLYHPNDPHRHTHAITAAVFRGLITLPSHFHRQIDPGQCQPMQNTKHYLMTLSIHCLSNMKNLFHPQQRRWDAL